jgi:hypothetical protein
LKYWKHRAKALDEDEGSYFPADFVELERVIAQTEVTTAGSDGMATVV